MFDKDALVSVRHGYWMECFTGMRHEAAGRRCGLEFSMGMLNGAVQRYAGLSV